MLDSICRLAEDSQIFKYFLAEYIQQGASNAVAESNARWKIVNDSIALLEGATTASHLTGILNGEQIDYFPFPMDLDAAKPIIEYVDGWKCDISGVRQWDDLPKAAQDYVLMIEEAIGCPITYVSVGPERESIILR